MHNLPGAVRVRWTWVPREVKPLDWPATSRCYADGFGEDVTLAEREGFEPSVPARGTTVFETAPIDRSGTSPSSREQVLSTGWKRTKPGTGILPHRVV
jgi:hypothetical protein